MTEYRAKKMQKIAAKINNLYEELELLIDAEIRHMNEYDACEDVCRNMTDADLALRQAAYAMQQAEACAEMVDMQDQMQQSMDKMTESS